MMESKYLSWLEEKGVPLFHEGGTYWKLYRGALVPASPYPNYHELDHKQSHSLLKKSGAWFIRYSSSPCEHETAWWYIVCDRYDPALINAKIRREIKRGQRECVVEEIDAAWLADNGYPCYCAAFERYKEQKPVSESRFRQMTLDACGGPFSYWGVFHEGHIAGYCKCIIEEKQVSLNTAKYYPIYLRHRSAYALLDKLIQTYVVGQGMTLSNGNRSVAHETNFQDVLIRLGFRKQFCRLKVVYNPWLKIGIEALYPLRSLIAGLPDRHIIPKIRALLFQEEIRREAFGNRG